jgi:pimeloyl-ACP methyl ester carboxylesterase
VGAPCGDDHDWTCGSLTVPLDRSEPSAGTIRLHFRVLPREVPQDSSAGTIVVVAGGPGQSSVEQYRWARFAFHSFLANHDLLLVDNRGTGASGAIDCPMLQAEQPYLSTEAVAECRRLLGARADDYGTVAAVDDLNAVLTLIQARHVDLYAESYGTYFAQVFALRHPQHLQRMVLDGAYPLAVDPWHRDEIPAALTDLRSVCQTDARCRAAGDPVALLAHVLPRLRAENPTAKTSDAFGRLVNVHGSVPNLAFALEEAGRDGSAYRELPAALAAASRTPNPDPLPLLRLIAERQQAIFGPSRLAAPDPSSLSIGLLVADTCADYPQPFRLTDPITAQTNELQSARLKFETSIGNTLAPFNANEIVDPNTGCLGWPAPTSAPPTSHAPFPKVPTLVLEGALDTITPPTGAQTVERAFPKGHYLQIPNLGHVTAVTDNTECAADIAAYFLTSDKLDTSCIPRIPAPALVDAFPTRLTDEAPAATVLKPDAAGLSVNDLRTIAVTRDAISDVMWHWGRVGILSGHGLRGGTFNASGPLQRDNVDLQLRDIKWTTDTQLSGDLHVSPATDSLAGAITLTTSTATVRLNIQSNLFGNPTIMTITGSLAGHKINLLVQATINL